MATYARRMWVWTAVVVMCGCLGCAGAVHSGASSSGGASAAGVARAMGDADAFERAALNGGGLACAMFFVPGCTDCLRIEPHFAALAAQRARDARYYRVNLHEARHLARLCVVAATPTMVVYAEGKEIERVVRPRLRADLDATLDKAIRRLGE